MKLLVVLFYIIIGNFNLYTIELEIEVRKTTRQNSIDLPSGKEYVSFRHEGGFKNTLAKYGSYFCEAQFIIIRRIYLKA